MLSSRLISRTLCLLITIFSITLSAFAYQQEEAEEYDVKARVVRISLINGEVTLKRNGNTEWERARLNFPLVEGDTVSTDRESRLEIQIDARNFVRLAANTTMQIVSLRNEGVAVSVVEGTATVRLVKFDRQREYFEVDAPRTTMAAEKRGLYRIDVPGDGRVRLSVRDGGSARIYSDTSGFALRDGRTAELVVAGVNSGDWEFVANAARDAIDEWVSDRERYLAQRLRYDTQYYDEYVWGAEDLDAYGDWSYAPDYGWVWRPHTTVINVYQDWAPYRYGHWVWCPPYGWTWVGYEPWGWAPYHYGRWVYLNGGWSWCPRSSYYRDHSWWRPALVAFYYVDDNYCWYPLGYRQRDPRSSYYNNKPERLTALRAEELAQLRRVNPVHLRAVTTANAKQIGNENLRPQRADDALARRALGTVPVRTGLPARAPAREATTQNPTGQTTVGRPARTSVSDLPIERSTGAAARTPGVPLDGELRRTRVLNGREARPSTPTVTSTSTTSETEVETRPTGAVTRPVRTSPSTSQGGEERPERRNTVTPSTPNDDTVSRPTRTEPVVTPDPGEKPTRNRERLEPSRPERRVETPSPSYEPPPQRSEPPRVSAPQRSEPPPRVEAPRSSPPQRSEPPPQRSEPPARPSRPESSERPSRSESPRYESPRSEPSRSEPTRSEPTRSEPSRSEPPRSEPSRPEPRTEPARDPDSGRPSRPDRPRT